MSVSGDTLVTWAKPPSDTEDQRCLNAINGVMDVLRKKFGNKVTFIRQGSHTNNTNIRVDSDVDIAVVHSDSNFSNTFALSPDDRIKFESAWVNANYTFAQLKSDVHSALLAEFGNAQRKNKCIHLPGNTYRVNADVVPAFPLIRYSAYQVVEAKGIAFIPDNGMRIESFPEQHYANGVKKNGDTARAFKSLVRILKHVRGALQDRGEIARELMPSFFLECLVWNAPNELFMHKTWREDALAVTAKIWSDMRSDKIAKDYAEVSDLKWLLRGANRTPKQAEDFMHAAWNFLKV